jgi:general secretion pathway protein A
LINIICDRALLGAYGQGARQVSASLARAAAREVLRESAGGLVWRPWLALGVGLAGLALIGIGLWLPHTNPTPTVASTVPSSPIVSSDPSPSRGTISTPASVAPAQTASTNSLDVAAWLRKVAADNANDRLLAVWGVKQPLGGKGPFCEQVKVYQLRCLTGRGDWDLLRRYDHPALLRLTTPSGHSGQVLLRVLTKDNATLEIAGEMIDVPLTQLTALWTRDYLLLWRSPIKQPVLGPGATGEEVLWLRQRLAQATGQTSPEPLSALFDANLSRQLRAFQQDHGLQPDGLAGERTLALLSNLAPEPDAPVLRPPERKH